MLGKWNELSSYWFFDVNDLPVFPLQPLLQNGYSDREKSENQKRSKKEFFTVAPGLSLPILPRVLLSRTVMSTGEKGEAMSTQSHSNDRQLNA